MTSLVKAIHKAQENIETKTASLKQQITAALPKLTENNRQHVLDQLAIIQSVQIELEAGIKARIEWNEKTKPKIPPL